MGEFRRHWEVHPARPSPDRHHPDLGNIYRRLQNGAGHKHVRSAVRYGRRHRLSLGDNSINLLSHDE